MPTFFPSIYTVNEASDELIFSTHTFRLDLLCSMLRNVAAKAKMAMIATRPMIAVRHIDLSSVDNPRFPPHGLGETIVTAYKRLGKPGFPRGISLEWPPYWGLEIADDYGSYHICKYPTYNYDSYSSYATNYWLTKIQADQECYYSDKNNYHKD